MVLGMQRRVQELEVQLGINQEFWTNIPSIIIHTRINKQINARLVNNRRQFASIRLTCDFILSILNKMINPLLNTITCLLSKQIHYECYLQRINRIIDIYRFKIKATINSYIIRSSVWFEDVMVQPKWVKICL